MKVYIAHSSSFNYKKELYVPIRQSSLSKKHDIVLPHELSSKLFDSKNFLKNSGELIRRIPRMLALG